MLAEQEPSGIEATRAPTTGRARYVVTVRGRRVMLTAGEFAVLDVLLRAGGRAVAVEEILWQAWRERDTTMCGKVRIAVARLRRRLGERGLIETIGGEGYRLVTTEELAR
ncbi:MAG TPA: winged helix-turn-helix domain-containing protein [Dehalococcoidia bacterium]